MATELRLRRGTTDEHGNFIGAEAEATVDTDKNTIVVHDGQTQGGFPLSREDITDVSVDSVATLRTSSFPANLERLYLSGYYGVGTPGGGDLYRDSSDTTAADNGGTVFVDGDGVRWKRPNSSVVYIEEFGAVGDYDPATETEGQEAVNATDNFDSINNARLYFEDVLQGGELVIAGSGENRDFWASNMPRFQLSNFKLRIEKGTTLRTTTPTSFGSTVAVGEAGVTTNVMVCGGGAVRNYLPELSQIPAWSANTAFEVGDYVSTTDNHAYYCSQAGTSGTTEPTVIAGSETDGTVVWRDALNENGISVSGDDAFVIGMEVPEASNKGISIQSPPWDNCWFKDNIVGKTHHDGIEMKGNQGISGQENLFAQRGFIVNNIVKDAGRNGFHVEQPSFGNNKNRDITVVDNICVRNGYRHSDKLHPAFRVNRCVNPVFRGNKALDPSGNGVHIRKCENVIGDVYVEKCGIFALHLQENFGFSLNSVFIKQGASGYEALRENACTGSGWYGSIAVYGGDYTYAFREVARGSTAKMAVGNISLATGTLGRVDGNLPNVSIHGISNVNENGYIVTENSVSLGSTGRQNIISFSNSAVRVLSGTVQGNASLRLEILMGGDILQLSGASGFDSAGNEFQVFNVPPIYAPEGLVVRVNNNSTSTSTIGWSVIYQEL